MTKLEEFKKDLNFLLITARKPLVWLESFDYVYIIKTLKEVFDINKDVEEKDIAIWDIATCLITDINGKKISFVDNKAERTQTVKDNIEQQAERPAKNAAKLGKRVAMFRSMPNKGKNNSPLEDIVKEREMNNPLTNKKLLVAKVSEELFEDKDDRLVARLQDFVVANNDISILNKKTILLISTYHFDVKGLEHICERLELPIPDRDDIRRELCLDCIDNNKNDILFSESFKMEVQKNSDMLIDAIHGMYLYDIVNLLKTIQTESKFGKISPFDYNYGKLEERVKQGKKQIVKNSGLLEVIEINEKNYHEHIADIENLRKHLENEKHLIDNKQFLQSNLPRPRGILLVGAPGCGKSESAKATASILDLPLYRMDIGNLMGHKYGQSENRFNEALRTADGSAPCVLWIDEIEKAFAGAGSGDQNNDVLTHIIGRFLTWMQEHRTIVYLVATANDLSQMRPELLRTGRWDKRFYLSYPSIEGRRDILNKCLQRYHMELVDDAFSKPIELDKITLFEDAYPSAIIELNEGEKRIVNLLKQMDGMSGSDISNMVVEIAKDAFIEREDKVYDDITKKTIKVKINSLKIKVEKRLKDNLEDYPFIPNDDIDPFSISIKNFSKDINDRIRNEIYELEIRRAGELDSGQRHYLIKLLAWKFLREKNDAKKKYSSKQYELDGYVSASSHPRQD